MTIGSHTLQLTAIGCVISVEVPFEPGGASDGQAEAVTLVFFRQVGEALSPVGIVCATREGNRLDVSVDVPEGEPEATTFEAGTIGPSLARAVTVPLEIPGGAGADVTVGVTEYAALLIRVDGSALTRFGLSQLIAVALAVAEPDLGVHPLGRCRGCGAD